MKQLRIIIADGHKLLRDGWASFLNQNERFSVVATTGNAEEAIELVQRLQPDIILMDYCLTPLSGVEATQKIKALQPGTLIVGVSIFSQPHYAIRMMQMGAVGYVTKSSSMEELIKAIFEAAAGQKYICHEIKDALTNALIYGDERRNDMMKLTERELQIIDLVKEGNSSKKIGELLYISLKTVEVHRHNILKKLQLPNSSALVNFMHVSENHF